MEWQRSRLPSCEVSEMLCERPSQSQADDILFIHVCLWSVRNIMWWVVIHGIHQMLLNDWMNVHMFRDSLCWIQSESSSDTLHSSKHVTKCYHRTITFNTSSGRAPQFAHFLFFLQLQKSFWPHAETRVQLYTSVSTRRMNQMLHRCIWLRSSDTENKITKLNGSVEGSIGKPIQRAETNGKNLRK